MADPKLKDSLKDAKAAKIAAKNAAVEAEPVVEETPAADAPATDEATA